MIYGPSGGKEDMMLWHIALQSIAVLLNVIGRVLDAVGLHDLAFAFYCFAVRMYVCSAVPPPLDVKTLIANIRYSLDVISRAARRCQTGPIVFW